MPQEFSSFQSRLLLLLGGSTLLGLAVRKRLPSWTGAALLWTGALTLRLAGNFLSPRQASRE